MLNWGGDRVEKRERFPRWFCMFQKCSIFLFLPCNQLSIFVLFQLSADFRRCWMLACQSIIYYYPMFFALSCISSQILPIYYVFWRFDQVCPKPIEICQLAENTGICELKPRGIGSKKLHTEYILYCC